MKTKKISLSIVILTVCASIFSCQSESIEDFEQEEQNSEEITSRFANAGEVGTHGDMLYFSDMETFLNVIESLEEQTEKYDDEFLEEWGHLKGDDLDDLEDEIGYDPDQVFIDFESQFSKFTSLREITRAKELEWLDNEELDDENDPDDHYIFDDEVRTVVNGLGNVKIGDLLYHFTRYGHVTVKKNNVKLLNTIAKSNAEEFVNLDDVEIFGDYVGGSSSGNYANNSGNNSGNNAPQCRNGFDRSRYYYPSSSRRLKGKQKLAGSSGIWGSRIKSKTVHYKKRNGKWKRRRGEISAQIKGFTVNQQCVQEANESKSKTRRRRSVKVKIKAPLASGYNYKTRQMELRTVHKKISTNSIYDQHFWE